MDTICSGVTLYNIISEAMHIMHLNSNDILMHGMPHKGGLSVFFFQRGIKFFFFLNNG